MTDVDLPAQLEAMSLSNQASPLVQTASYVFRKIIRELDPRTFLRLQQTCRILFEKCYEAEPSVCLRICTIHVNGFHGTRELQVYRNYPRLCLQFEEMFALTEMQILIYGIEFEKFEVTEADIDYFLALFEHKRVTVERLHLRIVECSLEKMKLFVEKFNVARIYISGRLPDSYLSDRLIMNKVFELVTYGNLAGSPDFMLWGRIQHFCVFFDKEFTAPFTLFRQIVKELATGLRSFCYWDVGYFNPDLVENLFVGWPMALAGFEYARNERPLVAKTVNEFDSLYRLFCTDGKAYIIDCQGGSLLIRAFDDYEDESFSNDNESIDFDFEAPYFDFADENNNTLKD